MRTTDECLRLLAGNIADDDTIDDYIQHTRIDEEGTWGSQTEMYVLAHMTGQNIFSFNIQMMWHVQPYISSTLETTSM